ncbi:MAG: hypothetical protein AAGF01_25185 [Cyanobacteria bacterium P01_G01_bin.38]
MSVPPSDFETLVKDFAEIKRVVGLLWKSSEASQQSAQDAANEIARKIEAWTEINQALLQLLSSKTDQEAQMMENYGMLVDTLLQFSRGMQGLNGQLASLEQSSTSLGNSLADRASSEKELNQQISNLRQGLDGLIQYLKEHQIRGGQTRENQTNHSSQFPNLARGLNFSPSTVACWVAGGLSTLTVLLLSGWYFVALPHVRAINERAAWSLQKLERLEQYLGIETE